MKNVKNIVMAMMTVVLVVLGGMYISKANQVTKLEQQLEEVNAVVEDYDVNNEELDARVSELEEVVWNIHNKEDYSVSVNHDDTTYTYTRTNSDKRIQNLMTSTMN